MSLSYWMIVGLGLSMKELFPYLQASKVRQRLREQGGRRSKHGGCRTLGKNQ